MQDNKQAISNHLKLLLYCTLAITIVGCAFFVADQFSLWHLWGIPRSQEYGADFYALVSAAKCDALGYNTFLTNPCDPYDRVHVYSPWWLILDNLGATQANAHIISTTISVLFIISVVLILQPENIAQLFFVVTTLLSSAIALGIERANNDLIIFILIALACRLLSATSTAAKFFAFILIMLASTLKFYPLVAFSVYLRATLSNVRFWLIALIAALAFTTSIAISWQDLNQLSLPSPAYRYTFGARYLFQFILPSLPYFKITLLVWSALLVASFIVVKPQANKSNGDLYKELLFIAGYSMALVAFVFSNNYEYRCIFFILCLPMLLLYLKDGNQRNNIKLIIAMIIVVCWWELIVNIAVSFGGERSQLAYSALWIEQVITWFLMIKLLIISMRLTKPLLLQRLGLDLKG